LALPEATAASGGPHEVAFSQITHITSLLTVGFQRRRPLCHGDEQRPLAEEAVAWTLRHPAVTGAIMGARSAEQVEGVMAAGDFRLSEEEIAAIERGID
jgi:hypothetical protein